PKGSGREIHRLCINVSVGLNTLPISGRAGRWEMEIQFSVQVALVAGGTGGLGCAVSLAFLGEGAAVIATCRQEKEFEALKSASGENSARLDGRLVDATDESAVRGLVDAIMAKYGRL